MSKKVWVELAIVGLLVGTAVAISVSCGGEGPTTAPSQQELEQTSSSSSATVTTPVVVPPTGVAEGQRSFEAEFLSDGSVNVKNNLAAMGWPSVVYHDCTASQPCHNEVWRDTKGIPPGGVVKFGPPPTIKFCSRLFQVDLVVDEKDIAWKFYDRRAVPCPDPTPQPTPTPSPSPTPTPSPSPTPTPTPCTKWSKATATATSSESGNWSMWAGSTKLWEGKLTKGQSHEEPYPADGSTLKLKYGNRTYAQTVARCPEVGAKCTGTLVFTCGCK